MSRPKVFVTRRIPEIGLMRIERHCECHVWEGHLPPPREALCRAVQGCTGILSLLSDRIDAEVMDAAGEQLRVISNFAVGFNNIDIASAAARTIAVGNTPGVLTDATADIALALILSVARRLPEAMDQVRNHQWETWEPLGWLGHDLRGKTLGIIGMGRIGQAVAQRCQGGWGMQVLYSSRSPRTDLPVNLKAERVSLEELLGSSDVVSLHADYNPSTHQIMAERTLRLMKSSAILINTARGGLIDQAALYRALTEKWIWGAGLDVTEPEPIAADSPLRSVANCLILPHIGSATYAARDAMADIAADNLIAGVTGQPLRHQVC